MKTVHNIKYSLCLQILSGTFFDILIDIVGKNIIMPSGKTVVQVGPFWVKTQFS
jgi:hypothetical protein